MIWKMTFKIYILKELMLNEKYGKQGSYFIIFKNNFQNVCKGWLETRGCSNPIMKIAKNIFKPCNSLGLTWKLHSLYFYRYLIEFEAKLLKLNPFLECDQILLNFILSALKDFFSLLKLHYWRCIQQHWIDKWI